MQEQELLGHTSGVSGEVVRQEVREAGEREAQAGRGYEPLAL